MSTGQVKTVETSRVMWLRFSEKSTKRYNIKLPILFQTALRQAGEKRVELESALMKLQAVLRTASYKLHNASGSFDVSLQVVCQSQDFDSFHS